MKRRIPPSGHVTHTVRVAEAFGSAPAHGYQRRESQVNSTPSKLQESHGCPDGSCYMPSACSGAICHILLNADNILLNTYDTAAQAGDDLRETTDSDVRPYGPSGS